MLHTLPKITKTTIKRLGRGFGSGVGGHTVGRGTKGHTSRTGKSTPLWFEGGQLPFIRRFPFMRGKFRFKTLIADIQEVQAKRLQTMEGKDITPETLFAAGLIRNPRYAIKIIGTAELSGLGEVRGVMFTAASKKAVEAGGGKIGE